MLYLSDAIRGKYVQDEFNVIEAPCGCGKTEYAVNKLPYEILGSKPQFNKVLYCCEISLRKKKAYSHQKGIKTAIQR